MRAVRNSSGQILGQIGGGSLPSSPRMEMDPVMLTPPTVLKLAMPLPVCPGVFCTEITPVFELLKDVSRVTSEVLPSPHWTAAVTCFVLPTVPAVGSSIRLNATTTPQIM